MAHSSHDGEIRPFSVNPEWKETVSTTLFDLELESRYRSEFFGRARTMQFGSVQVVRFSSSAMAYRRLIRHCKGDEPQILMSIPLAGCAQFEQFGRRIQCSRGEFLLEYSEAPYEFQYKNPCDFWILKLPELMLQSRMGNTLRYCAVTHSADQGMGRLLQDYISLAAAQHFELNDSHHKAMIGIQMADLLGATLEAQSDATQSTGSAVKAAHLARIEKFIRTNLTAEDLTPARIAGECGISVRYLHLLFKESDRTLTSWIRELRLLAAHELLQSRGSTHSVAQIAYTVGFGDHAQFSNAFRRRFGFTPSELLKKA